VKRDGWRERVALRIYDAMTADGVTPDHAALIGQAALAELRRDPTLSELFLVRQTDSFGQPHAVVVRQLPAGNALPLHRFEIRGMGRVARQAIAREFDVHLTEGTVGTEV
jgi:hypothetical protein